MSRNFDKLFREIVTVLRTDYAAAACVGERFDPRYYNTAIGQAWHDDKLDDLLFLRYVSQMLACTGDHSLQLRMLPDENYTPWYPGFFTRRWEDSLYVTAAAGETRLHVGDRITAINRGAPSHHRQLIQRNFFYADEPEREEWNGLLKMADSVTVLHDGIESEIMLEHHPVRPFPINPAVRLLPGGVLLLRPGVFDGSGSAVRFLEQNRSVLKDHSGLVLDLRNTWGSEEEEIYPFLPLLTGHDRPMDELLDTRFAALYTPRNCALLASAADDEEYTQYLAAQDHTGFTLLDLPFDETVPAGKTVPTAVLADTWTQGAAEKLVLAAERCGIPVIGRETRGTLNTASCVNLALDESYVLSWPALLTERAHRGAPAFSGVRPGVYIPWTPDEFDRDIPAERAADILVHA